MGRNEFSCRLPRVMRVFLSDRSPRDEAGSVVKLCTCVGRRPFSNADVLRVRFS